MSIESLIVQLLNGLASASSLFLVAAGLSLIFGVMRIVNFAHGSFYMVAAYLAYTLVEVTQQSLLGIGVGQTGSHAMAFWLAIPITALAIAAFGAIVEITLLRRIYHVPELFQLLATFALLLIIKDAALWLWGPEELLGPRAPGLQGAVQILGRAFPTYDLFLIAIGPLILLALWLFLHRTQWGVNIRAATQDREMVATLGVNQAWLFTSVFALSAFLAGLAGALNLPRESVNLDLDLQVIGSAFVVVVVGGLGSIPGAFLAAILISLIKAFCIALGVVSIFGVEIAFPKLTLVAEFLVMATVLIWRPWGLLGKSKPEPYSQHAQARPLTSPTHAQQIMIGLIVMGLFVWPFLNGDVAYLQILAVDLLLAVLFAASLHFMMGPAGLHSFGHAAYFGVGAYAAALVFKTVASHVALAILVAPMFAALMAMLLGAFAIRLSGVYLAMLTLAFAQILWAIAFQWDAVTGGSNGLIGIWPPAWLADQTVFYFVVLCFTLISISLLWTFVFSPFGLAMRAARDAAQRAESIGVPVKWVQWWSFVIAATFAGLAGGLYVFAKGSVSPEVMGVTKSIDGLVMVLLGGIQTLVGPIIGAITFVGLNDVIVRHTEYWRAALGALILLLVLVCPQGLAGIQQSILPFGKRAST